MSVYRIIHLSSRALLGIKRRPWLHFLSLLTLSAAFLSFTATLTTALNLDKLLNNWVGGAELTAYLRDGTSLEEQSKLARAVEKIQGVKQVEAITRERAKQMFAAEMGTWQDMARSLPSQVFPASLEIHLEGSLAKNPDARRELAHRIGQVALVENVELYDDWFARLSGLTLVGRIAAWGLGILALAVAVLVVAATVRSSVSSRAREIEVLGIVGASRRYVVTPFILEGAIEACAAMALALIGLSFILDSVEQITGGFSALFGMGEIMRIGASTHAYLLLSSAFSGIIGARLSLKGLVHV